MSEFDRYVRSIQDLLGHLPSPAERLNALEEVVGRLSGGSDPRRATQELLGGMVALPERMAELQRVLSEFANPAERLRELETNLSSTRQQLELAAKQLESAEEAVGRVAALAEQLALLQEPFVRTVEALRGGGEPPRPDAG
jgi:chromosome segregation ATPase